MSHGNSPSVFYYRIISRDGCGPRECWGPLTPFPRVPLRLACSLVASGLLHCSARSQFSPRVETSSGLMPILLKRRASGWLNGGDPGTPALAGREEASPAAASPWGCCAGSARVPLSSLPSHLGQGGFLAGYTPRPSTELSARGLLKLQSALWPCSSLLQHFRFLLQHGVSSAHLPTLEHVEHSWGLL